MECSMKLLMKLVKQLIKQLMKLFDLQAPCNSYHSQGPCDHNLTCSWLRNSCRTIGSPDYAAH